MFADEGDPSRRGHVRIHRSDTPAVSDKLYQVAEIVGMLQKQLPTVKC